MFPFFCRSLTVLCFAVAQFTYIRSLDVPLVLFGVDGFGYELYKAYGNKSNGALNVIPLKTVYPSKTFPNFYSIATGLYPAQTGIVSNKFLNKQRNKTFHYENEQAGDFDWYKGEPIWITAKKAGLRVYTDMWVGTAAEYDGVRPDFYSVYNDTKTIEEKVTDLVENLDSNDRCDLYIMYTDKPDWFLHRSDMTNKTLLTQIINEAERQIDLLKTALGTRQVNFVVVSDHGMASYTTKYTISSEMSSWAEMYYGGAFALWYTKGEGDAQMTDLLHDINTFLNRSNMVGTKAYRVSDLPPRFQLCGLEEEGMPEIVFVNEEEVALNVWSQKSGHGWDNTLPNMFAQLRVAGPGFRKIPFIEQMNATMNTELYNMFCSLLGIVPTNNTGRLDTFDFMLSSPPNRSDWVGDYVRVPEPCYSAGDIPLSLSHLVLCVGLLVMLIQ